MSKDLNISKEQPSGREPPSRSSAYGSRSSEIYPSVSTDLNSNSTLIRIRDKNSYILSKKTNTSLPKHNSFIPGGPTKKRRDLLKAKARLKKIEMIEQKRIGRVKEEIIKLEEERKREEAMRKKKRKELLERKEKLILDRKKLELQKQKRLKNKESSNELPNLSSEFV